MPTPNRLQDAIEQHNVLNTPPRRMETECDTTPDDDIESIISALNPLSTAPEFTLQLNTQTEELLTLREQYPHEIRMYNYQTTPIVALHGERQSVRGALGEIQRLKAALHVMQNMPPKYKRTTDEMIASSFSSRQQRELSQTTNYRDLRAYHLVVEHCARYKRLRNEFLSFKERYSAQQAEFNQRSAMIRQKPNIPTEIDTNAILETVSQWENVWGINIGVNRNYMNLRIGLCDITMDESAQDTCYENPESILLAPFYFNIKLYDSGSFVCSSDDASGLSRSNDGRAGSDFHPHQLSDTPCFGTFGQTFIDLAIRGDIISLIGGIIAFYSQYNSADSAGVNARYYHPYHIPPMLLPEAYNDNLKVHITHRIFHKIDTAKLDAAIGRYTTYHETACNQQPPELLQTDVCNCCEENDVSDDTDYRCTVDGERICVRCWENTYCGDCERHEEDCECEREEY